MAKDRYIAVAFVGPNAFVEFTYDEGTKEFDTIWRDAPSESTHIVLFAGSYFVTDRFQSILHMDAHVSPGPMDMFDTREAAMMAAVMKAGHGSDRDEFTHRLLGRWNYEQGNRRLDQLVKLMYGL